MGTKMRPSHANLFVSFNEHQFFFVNKTARPFSQFLRLRRLYCYDSDFSEKSEAMCHFFSINVATLFLSFKQASNAPNKLIYRQHYKRLRRKILIAFHSLSHFTLATAQLDLSFLKL